MIEDLLYVFMILCCVALIACVVVAFMIGASAFLSLLPF